jgi:hypothetical protein
MTGNTITIDDVKIDTVLIERPKQEIVVELIKETTSKITITKEEKKKKVYSEGDEDDELEMEEDEDGNLSRSEEILNLDDEFDDTFGEKPDGYTFEENKEEPKEEDEWSF